MFAERDKFQYGEDIVIDAKGGSPVNKEDTQGFYKPHTLENPIIVDRTAGRFSDPKTIQSDDLGALKFVVQTQEDLVLDRVKSVLITEGKSRKIMSVDLVVSIVQVVGRNERMVTYRNKGELAQVITTNARLLTIR